MRNKRFIKYFHRNNSETESYEEFIERINFWIEENDVIVLNMDRMDMFAIILFYEKRENR